MVELWGCLNLFPDKAVPATNKKGRRYVELNLEDDGHCAKPPFNLIPTPTSFEVLMCLHSMCMFHEVAKEMKQRMTQWYRNGTLM